jgi:hypothetical protein
MSLDHDTERRVLLCIYDVLDSLDQKGRRNLQNYFENDNILEEPERFRKGLTLVFGDRGAKAVETWIVTRLVSSFELKKEPNLSLAKAIEMIKIVETGSCKRVKARSRNHHVHSNHHREF